MQRIPGWIVGALGTAAVVGAFYMGGRAIAAPAAPEATVALISSTPASFAGMEFTCEPGQRVVVREATTTTPQSFACVGAAATAVSQYAMTPAGVMTVADRSAASPYAQPAVMTQPLEVYRPRSVPVSYQSERDVRRTPVRTKTKSAVIIGSSTAVGATIGGLTKGKKGAVIGGLIGGGAAAVWDQVTRRQGNDR